ncbi:MAG: hypothetical protein IE931_01100 [Sphingobacteriales bacterium]|nr:hypothetical protein [Sphingobacteriales bacterium]
MSEKNILEDFKINIKLKLALLWASVTLLYLYGDYFELYVPNKTAGLVNGENLLDSPIKLFLASFLLAIPAMMVVLSILLKPQINKILNIIFGLSFSFIMILIGVISFESWRAFYVFYAFLESFITILITYLAFNWPKKIANGK